MKYYQRNLGDYARDTGHLTALEHGVFNLLLDWYYANERPIPESLVPAIARGEVEAAANVLPQFFKLTRNGWRNSHAERIILEYQAKCDRNSAVGRLGGRPKKTQTDNSGFPKKTLSSNHYPVSNKEQKKKQPQAALPEVPGWIDSDAWAGFVAMRIKERHPMTPRAASLILKKLEALKAEGHDPTAILDTSTRNGWRDVFPPKPMNGNGNGKSTLASRLAAEARSIAADDAAASRDDAQSLAMDGGLLRPQMDFIDG